MGNVGRAGEVSGDLSINIKVRIQAAVAVVTGQGKVEPGGHPLVRTTRDDDLAIRLDGDAEAPVLDTAEVGGDLPITIKVRIQAAVAVVAGQGKLIARPTHHHDLAIRLNSDAPGNVPRAGDVGGDLPITIKGRIQAAVAVVAGYGKVRA